MDQGIVHLLHGGDAFIFGDGFEFGGVAHWSGAVP